AGPNHTPGPWGGGGPQRRVGARGGEAPARARCSPAYAPPRLGWEYAERYAKTGCAARRSTSRPSRTRQSLPCRWWTGAVRAAARGQPGDRRGARQPRRGRLRTRLHRLSSRVRPGAAGARASRRRRPDVVAAVQNQLPKGSTYYFLNEPVIRLAERMVEACPCADQVHFTGSGTEATFFALRVARA